MYFAVSLASVLFPSHGVGFLNRNWPVVSILLLSAGTLVSFLL
jgi:hypothetical protein